MIATGIHPPRSRALALDFLLPRSRSFLSLGTLPTQPGLLISDREDWRAGNFLCPRTRAQRGNGAFPSKCGGNANFDACRSIFYRSRGTSLTTWPEALVGRTEDWATVIRSLRYLGCSTADAQPAEGSRRAGLSFNNSSNGEPTRETAMLLAVYGKGRRLMEEKRIRGSHPLALR